MRAIICSISSKSCSIVLLLWRRSSMWFIMPQADSEEPSCRNALAPKAIIFLQSFSNRDFSRRLPDSCCTSPHLVVTRATPFVVTRLPLACCIWRARYSRFFHKGGPGARDCNISCKQMTPPSFTFLTISSSRLKFELISQNLRLSCCWIQEYREGWYVLKCFEDFRQRHSWFSLCAPSNCRILNTRFSLIACW